jgi:transcriptional regulator with XRE-family HTH domain
VFLSHSYLVYADFMRKQTHLCPVGWYIGQSFRYHRLLKNLSIEQISTDIGLLKESIILFEQGKLILDAMMLLKLEKYYSIDYQDYKPPVSYFGLLGIVADKKAMLRLSQQSTHKMTTYLHSSNKDFEDQMLSVRYAPLRGKKYK